MSHNLSHVVRELCSYVLCSSCIVSFQCFGKYPSMILHLYIEFDGYVSGVVYIK